MTKHEELIARLKARARAIDQLQEDFKSGKIDAAGLEKRLEQIKAERPSICSRKVSEMVSEMVEPQTG